MKSTWLWGGRRKWIRIKSSGKAWARLENPVFTKETRCRMRGTKSYITLFVYLLVIIGILALALMMMSPQTWGGGSRPRSSEVGQVIFYVLAGVQIFFVCFISPACTSGSITMEREQRTLEMLVSTLLRARTIAIAKLGSALSFLVLLIITTAPIISLCFLFGGVSPNQVGMIYLLCLTCAVFFATNGLFWSTYAKRTSTATVLAYGTAGFLTVATFILYIVGDGIRSGAYMNRSLGEFLMQIGALSPFIGLISLAPNSGMPMSIIAPIKTELVCYWLATILLFWLTIRRTKGLRA